MRTTWLHHVASTFQHIYADIMREDNDKRGEYVELSVGGTMISYSRSEALNHNTRCVQLVCIETNNVFSYTRYIEQQFSQSLVWHTTRLSTKQLVREGRERGSEGGMGELKEIEEGRE